MKNVANNIFKIAVFAVSLAATVGLILLCIEIDVNNTPFFVAGCCLAGVVSFGVLILNAVGTRKLNNKYSIKNTEAMYVEMISEYERAQQDYIATEKRLKRSKNRIIFTKIAMYLCYVLAALLCTVGLKNAIFVGNDNTLVHLKVTVAVLCAFVAPLMWLDLLSFDKQESDFIKQCKLLPPNAFPNLYEVVQKAMSELNCDMPLKIYSVVGDSLSVATLNDTINIFVDAEEIYILTKDEFYQLLLHEIAHVVNRDTERSARLNRFKYCLERGRVNRWFFSAQILNFLIDDITYMLSCNMFYEQNADGAVLEHGDPQVCINGTAKIYRLALYNKEYDVENLKITESDKVPDDFVKKDIEHFYRLQQVHNEKWDFIMRHRIPFRQDSHPTFAMRMKFFGVTDYDVSQKETNEQYVAEQLKLLELKNKDLAEKVSAATIRETNKNLRELRNKTAEYNSKKADLALQEKTEYLQFLFYTDREECLKICDEIISQMPRNSYANFFKGAILAERLDASCVDCLYIAAEENFNFSEEATEAVGLFAVNTGNAELLEHYRERAPKDMVSANERREKTRLNKDSQMRANALSDDVYNEILTFIFNVGKDALKNVWSVSVGEGKDLVTTYILQEKNGVNPEESQKIYDKIFGFLDRYGDGVANYDFNLLYIGEKITDKILKKAVRTEGALIYNEQTGKVLR